MNKPTLQSLAPAPVPAPKKKKKKKKKKKVPAPAPVPVKTTPNRKRAKRGKPITSDGSARPGRSNDNLLAMFRSLDRNRNHTLSRKELKPLARRLKLDSKKMFQMMDNDGNGSINFAEFKSYMSAK